MYRALIIDDDPLIVDLVQHFCTKSGRFSHTLGVSNCKDALTLISSHEYEVIFLDYNLPDMKGHAFIELMTKETPIVMITSEAGFAVTSYKYAQVIDFLLKPLQYDRFLNIFTRLEERSATKKAISHQRDHLFLKDGTSLIKVNLSDVSFIKSDGNYLIYQLKSGNSVMSIGSLSKISKELPQQYISCHRSYLVNLSFVDAIDQNEIILGPHRVPLSHSKREEFLKLWTTYN